jgi:hypothetical protein
MDFTPHGAGTPVVFEFRDIDGDGGNAPVITVDTLTAQTEYHVVLTLTDESATPAEDITQEILDEDEDHQFFFTIAPTGLLLHAYDDMDGNGLPVGLENIFTSGNAGSGTLRLTLRHQPNKSAAGVNTGDITNAGGETDIEILFPLTVQ